MKVYRVRPHSGDNYSYIDFESALDLSLINKLLDGLKLTEKDINNKLKLKGKDKKLPDVLGTSSAEFLISNRVKLIIEKNVKDLNVNFIPLKIEDHDFWLLNIIGHLDCFDYESSDFTRSSNGSIRKIFDLKFISEKIPEYAIFRVKEADMHLFITEKLKNLLEETDTTGIRFGDNMNLKKTF